MWWSCRRRRRSASPTRASAWRCSFNRLVRRRRGCFLLRPLPASRQGPQTQSLDLTLDNDVKRQRGAGSAFVVQGGELHGVGGAGLGVQDRELEVPLLGEQGGRDDRLQLVGVDEGRRQRLQ